MKRLSLLKAALPMALVCGPLLADDVVEIHGYTRAGVGRSTNGGEQVSFFLANTGGSPTGGPGYRLGNETDNYLELAVDVKAYEKGNTNFKLHFRPAFRQYYQVRDASADAGGDVDNSKSPSPNQQIWIREACAAARVAAWTGSTSARPPASSATAAPSRMPPCGPAGASTCARTSTSGISGTGTTAATAWASRTSTSAS